MSENKGNTDESRGGVSFSLSGPALTSILCLLIVLILVLNLIGCVPVDASIRNNDGDGSACIVWGTKRSDSPSCQTAGQGNTTTETSSPL